MPWPTIFRGTSVENTPGIRPRPEDGLEDGLDDGLDATPGYFKEDGSPASPLLKPRYFKEGGMGVPDVIRQLINQGKEILGPKKEPTDSYVDTFGNTVHLDPVDIGRGRYSELENERRMSLTADERLREDRRTASGPTGLPRLIGTSPKDLVAKYYSGIEGGVDEAINAAQSAMHTPARDSKFEVPRAFNKWTPDRIEKVYKVKLAPVNKESGIHGQYFPEGDFIELGVPDKSIKNTDLFGNYRSTLQHESTHAYTNNPFDDIVRKTRRVSMRPDDNWMFEGDYAESPVPNKPEEKESFKAYLNRPSEADVRLAEIKREYAYATGILVRTPEQADAAMNWYHNNVELLRLGRGNRPENTRAERTLPGSLRERANGDPEYYEYSHPIYHMKGGGWGGQEQREKDSRKFDRDSKIYQQYMRRMPELVRSEKNYIGTKAT